MAKITTAISYFVAMGLLALALASPPEALLERPGRKFITVPRDRPPYLGPWRTWPIPLPSPPPDPEPEQPPAGEPPVPTLGPPPPPSPADQEPPEEHSQGEPDGSINGSPSVTTIDENPTSPTSPTPPPGSTSADENPEPGATGRSPGTPSDTEDDDDDDDDDAANMGDSNGDDQASSNRTLVITLSTVLSVMAAFLIVATLIACFRVKKRRMPFLARGISPIDDEEIESWKRRTEEKFMQAPHSETATTMASSSPGRLKKSPSVIVYHNSVPPPLVFEDSPMSAQGYARTHKYSDSQSRPRAYSHSHSHTLSFGSTKLSLDLLPQPPVLARAPNSRPGLTDEAIEGDEAFIPTSSSHRRQHSRISKKHSFSRSRSSSMSMWPAPSSPRRSDENVARTSYSRERKHARIYSDSSVPPRSSFDEDTLAGGLSPRPLVRGSVPTPESQIGRAIG